MTVHLEGGRTLNQIILVGASIQDSKKAALSVDYDLPPNLIIQARADYIDSAYPGVVRRDKEGGFQIGGKYLINHLISLDMNYTLTKRSTDALGGTFNDNQINVGITLHE